MTTLAKWSRKQNWRQWLTMHKLYCQICYNFGDALGNPRAAVLVVKGREMHPHLYSKNGSLRNSAKGYRLHLKLARDAFKDHVKTHHPEWLDERLDWAIRTR